MTVVLADERFLDGIFWEGTVRGIRTVLSRGAKFEGLSVFHKYADETLVKMVVRLASRAKQAGIFMVVIGPQNLWLIE